METEVPPEVRVLKARGRPSEPFKPEKIRLVLRRLSKDGTLSTDEIELLVRAISTRIKRKGEPAVRSSEIALALGELLAEIKPRLAQRLIANYDVGSLEPDFPEGGPGDPAQGILQFGRDD